MKFQLVRSPRKQIDTNFGCKALSFQLISIVSLLNLSSCDSNILKVNISDVMYGVSMRTKIASPKKGVCF